MGQTRKPNFHRRSIRMPGVDYYAEGSFFITLVTFHREHLFGEIVDGVMHLNDLGIIAREEWLKTQDLRPNVEIMEDEFVVMPNHFHGIVHIFDSNNAQVRAYSFIDGKSLRSETDDGAGKDTARRALTTEVFGQPRPGSLAIIVGAYKSSVTKRINLIRGTLSAKVWLRNYYDPSRRFAVRGRKNRGTSSPPKRNTRTSSTLFTLTQRPAVAMMNMVVVRTYSTTRFARVCINRTIRPYHRKQG